MSRRQNIILGIGFVLILATGLFPPWVQSWDFVAGGEDVQFRIGPGAEGYSWIFQPPGVPAWVHKSFRTPDDKEITDFQALGDAEITKSGVKLLLKSVRMPGSWRAQIDTNRLLVEWLIIIAGTIAGVVAFAPGKFSAGG